jgi:hypothetical protein
MVDILDLLLESSLTQHNKRAKQGKPIPVLEKRPQISTYQIAANWTATHAVALIHRSTDGEETLLGNFQEYLHKLGARKLCRVEAPTPYSAVEYVTGKNWLSSSQEHAREEQDGHWTHEHIFLIGITLKELILHSPEVAVKVTTMFGGISKVELLQESRFFSGTHSQFLMLHAGTDVLGCMDLDSKLDLKAKLDAKSADEEVGPTEIICYPDGWTADTANA